MASKTHSKSASSSSAHRPRRPSLSNMHWIPRSSGSKPKPIRVSEPTWAGGIETVGPRSGVLGQGATVVRTPEEALMDSRGSSMRSATPASADEYLRAPLSPPLPPLPAEDDEDDLDHYEMEDPGCEDDDDMDDEPAHATSLHSSHSRRSSLKSKSQTPTLFEESPTMHSATLPPIVLPPSPTQPTFNPVIFSPYASDTMMVVVETCTETFKTTVETLTSRPSHLASLFARPRTNSAVSTASRYSTASAEEDESVYRRHLSSQGLLAVPESKPISSPKAHIFLDRPSAPYHHILSYLRSSTETLPRAVILEGSSSERSVRFERLLELKDETSYLGLDTLFKLCNNELKRYAQKRVVQGHRPQYSIHAHTRGQSVHSARASVHSFTTGSQSQSQSVTTPEEAPRLAAPVHSDYGAKHHRPGHSPSVSSLSIDKIKKQPTQDELNNNFHSAEAVRPWHARQDSRTVGRKGLVAPEGWL